MLLVFYGQSHANDEESRNKKSLSPKAKEAPTKIRSDIIDIKRKSQTVNFIGNVVIEKEDSSFLSQKMTILYDEKKNKDEQEENKKSSIKKIYTDEKVKIFNEDFIATGDSGYYDPREDIFVLEQNVIVNNGVSVAKGDKFIHHISTKKSNFVTKAEEQPSGEDKRVTIILGDDAKDLKKRKNK